MNFERMTPVGACEHRCFSHQKGGNVYKECDESGDKEEKERDVIKEERNICRSNERLRRFIWLLEKSLTPS